MWKRFARLFVIKTRFEAFAIIYAIAMGAAARGSTYLDTYPGPLGYIFYLACAGAVFMAGAKILDTTRPRRRGDEERRVGERRANA